MPLAVLADKISQIRSQAHVRDCRLVITPFLYRKAFEKDESFAVDELFADGS